MKKEKKLGHFEETPIVAVVENFAIQMRLSEEQKQEGEPFIRRSVCKYLADLLYDEVKLTTVPTKDNETLVTAEIYVKKKDSDILRTGKTKFVRDK